MRAQRFMIPLFVISIFSAVLLPCVIAQTKSHPVTGNELIALVASESLDQNIVHAIESRGIAFGRQNNTALCSRRRARTQQ
jgi:hypothetical protein